MGDTGEQKYVAQRDSEFVLIFLNLSSCATEFYRINKIH